ncbi:MAG: aminotransferase class I/II-fold pyridoxal phosphate-dependent enzyme [Candidatus Latescibacteria bacterium]|nr:aminotransferase class I/II-fold pyridoxal phosphate-dependent enzyme [bacterium]MBD3425016.1 aminotransferase class I/II-fold pyridoxal phosphate-dependent enzyme [Candidatus Latescibacterota bacterium]
MLFEENLFPYLEKTDPEIMESVSSELKRQQNQLEMIASENFTSKAVLAALSNPMQNKYAEGYPGKRYYGGCEFVDQAERLARKRVKELFGAEHGNVQPHSGTQANITAYLAFIEPGDKIMGMSLSHGGHLSHGHPVNFSGMAFDVVHYEVDRETRMLNYDQLEEQARREQPKMFVAGASAYPREWDWARLREICDQVGAYLMVDIAHIAGLIAAGVHSSPIPYADVVTSTTHKTLRGPRGGFILCPKKYRKKVDKLNFPGTQGGPFMHVIAGKAVCFREAMTDEFKAYQKQVKANAARLASHLMENGFDIVSGGTDNHLFLIDLSEKDLTGKDAEAALENAGITVNKNTVPFDKESPFVTSGIRVGTPALTTRGMKEEQMDEIGSLMIKVLENHTDENALKQVREKTLELARAFPLYE